MQICRKEYAKMPKTPCGFVENTMRICPAETGGFVEKNTPICRKQRPQENVHSRKTDLMSFSSCIYLDHTHNTPVCRKCHSAPHICRKRQLTLPIIVENLSHVCPIASLRCRNLPHNCRQNPRIGRNKFLHLIVCQAIACSDMRLYTIFILYQFLYSFSIVFAINSL